MPSSELYAAKTKATFCAAIFMVAASARLRALGAWPATESFAFGSPGLPAHLNAPPGRDKSNVCFLLTFISISVTRSVAHQLQGPTRLPGRAFKDQAYAPRAGVKKISVYARMPARMLGV